MHDVFFLKHKLNKNGDCSGVEWTENISNERNILLSIVFHQQISYSSTSPELSVKTKYPYFYRTIPDDTSFSAPRVALLKTFKWSHVGVIFQEEDIHRTVTINASAISTILAKLPWDTWQNDNCWRIFLKREVIIQFSEPRPPQKYWNGGYTLDEHQHCVGGGKR